MQSSFSTASLIHQLDQLEQQFLTQRLRNVQLTPDQARVIRFVQQHPDTNQRLLGTALHRQAASLSNLVKGLVQRQLLTRQVSPNNEREKQLRLTDTGVELAMVITKIFDALYTQADLGLADAQRIQLQKLLAQVKANFEGKL